ncbi:MAG: addiction module protein [Nitrospirota bacterium]
MSGQSQALLEQALKLPVNERAELAEQLLRSLDPVADRDVEAAWQKEVQRRLSEVERGVAEMIPWEEVRERLRHGK